MAEREDAGKLKGDAEAYSDDALSGPPVEGANLLPLVDSPSLSPAEANARPESHGTFEAPRRVEQRDMPSDSAPLMPHMPHMPLGSAASDTSSISKSKLDKTFIFATLRRHSALLSMSVAITVLLGGAIGIWADSAFDKARSLRAASVAESLNEQALKDSIAHLTSEIASLKERLEASNKAASRQFAQFGERLKGENADVTGSIPATRPESRPTPVVAARVPVPRPHLATGSRLIAKPTLVPDWSIRDIADGNIYVESRDGNIFQAAPGVPLPGLGTVEQIGRRKGRWVVITTRGMIVSAGDRRYFESY
jgi:hypothetical protein